MQNSSRSNGAWPMVLALAAALALSTGVSAHRLDEYLQAARIALETDVVEIDVDLTPGVAVATPILAIIDLNADGTLSPHEQHAYAAQVVRDLHVALDGEALPLRLVSMNFPDASAFRHGEGTIRLRTSAAHSGLTSGPHLLHFTNAHLRTESVYLANALVPDNHSVSVMRQTRDAHQRELTIDYSVASGATSSAPVWLLISFAGVLAIVRARDIASLALRPSRVYKARPGLRPPSPRLRRTST